MCGQGDMEEVFEAALLSLPMNGVSGVVLTDSGAHLILRTAINRPLPGEHLVDQTEAVEQTEATDKSHCAFATAQDRSVGRTAAGQTQKWIHCLAGLADSKPQYFTIC
eukprot:COSAG03_NODE_1180_length_4634_cov_1.858655_6_plen_108_part_00